MKKNSTHRRDEPEPVEYEQVAGGLLKRVDSPNFISSATLEARHGINKAEQRCLIEEGRLAPYYRDSHKRAHAKPRTAKAGLSGQWAKTRVHFIKVFDPISALDRDHKELSRMWFPLEQAEKATKRPGSVASNIEPIEPLKALCSPELRWNQVKITMLRDEKTVLVTTPAGKDFFGFRELGFADKRKDAPNRLWQFLRDLCYYTGHLSQDRITKDNQGSYKNLTSTASRLNRHMREIFAIDQKFYRYPYAHQSGTERRYAYIAACELDAKTGEEIKTEMDPPLRPHKEGRAPARPFVFLSPISLPDDFS